MHRHALIDQFNICGRKWSSGVEKTLKSPFASGSAGLRVPCYANNIVTHHNISVVALRSCHARVSAMCFASVIPIRSRDLDSTASSSPTLSAQPR